MNRNIMQARHYVSLLISDAPSIPPQNPHAFDSYDEARDWAEEQLANSEIYDRAVITSESGRNFFING